jgi:hypothetical protein
MLGKSFHRKNFQQNLCSCDPTRPSFGIYYRFRYQLKLVLVTFLTLFYNDHLSW